MGVCKHGSIMRYTVMPGYDAIVKDAFHTAWSEGHDLLAVFAVDGHRGGEGGLDVCARVV